MEPTPALMAAQTDTDPDISRVVHENRAKLYSEPFGAITGITPGFTAEQVEAINRPTPSNDEPEDKPLAKGSC
jgi:hypothetical protein